MRTLLLICLSLLFTHHKAQARVTLESAVLDLEYALNVEWDQSDETFYQSTEALFAKRLSYLKKQGLTNNDIASFLLKKIPNYQIALDVQEFFEIVDSGLMSSEALSHHLMFLQSKWSHQGASWNGSPVGVAVIATLTVITSAVMVTTPLFQLY